MRAAPAPPDLRAPLPFPVVLTKPRRPVVGWIVSAAGWLSVFALVGSWDIMFEMVMERFGDLPGLVAFVVPLPAIFALLPGCIRLIARGRRIRAYRAVDVLARDPRPPVLLLRSFQDDDLIDPGVFARTRFVPTRYEDRLVGALRDLGPPIALGRPDESEPEPGAARLYVSGENWQRAISYLMDRAVAVITVLGRSQGLWWEIEAAAAKVPPERLLLFIPYPAPPQVRASYWRSAFLQSPIWGHLLRRKRYPALEAERQERYRVFREGFSGRFKHPLPEQLGGARFLHFDADGRPHLIPPVKPRLIVRLFSFNVRPTIDVPFDRELRPFVAKLARPTAATRGRS